MAKFRKNHQRKGFGLSMGKVLLFAVVLIGGLVFCFKGIQTLLPTSDYGDPYIKETAVEERFYIPGNSNGQIIHKRHFSLSYVEKYEQAEWVAYDLTIHELNSPKVKREKRFRPDYDVSTRSAFHRDYSRSGYTRGHLAPAADMAFDSIAMKESFYMSNISPQTRPFNNGIWRELEEQVRDWGRKYQQVYVVTGPLFDDIKGQIGQNRVTVPSSFFKVILDLKEPESKGIAFVIPHERSDRHLKEYAISIDQLEKMTGFDFFKDLMTPILETKLESSFNLDLWTFNDQRYQLRVDKWNHQ